MWWSPADTAGSFYRRTLAEDYSLSESRIGFRSKANENPIFGTFEFSAPRFHVQLDEQLVPFSPTP